MVATGLFAAPNVFYVDTPVFDSLRTKYIPDLWALASYDVNRNDTRL